MASNISPPPTWAPVIDKETGAFNPVWLQWFITVTAILNQTSGGGSGITHNSLSGLQGGTSNEYYHLELGGYNAIYAAGSMAYQVDTDVNITGGSVQGITTMGFGTYTAGTIVQAGSISIKDAGGTTRRLLVG